MYQTKKSKERTKKELLLLKDDLKINARLKQIATVINTHREDGQKHNHNKHHQNNDGQIDDTRN